MISNGWPRRPNVSRVHDYLLGGKDNYEEDRRFAENLLAVVPDAQAAARANRHFLGPRSGRRQRGGHPTGYRHRGRAARHV